jgi:uncharacterized membrane protein
MFWGKGDVSKLTPEMKAILDQLRNLEDLGFFIGLTPDQTKIAMAAIGFYSAVTATTGIIAGARNVLLFLGSLCVIYWSVKDVLIQFIKSSAGAP